MTAVRDRVIEALTRIITANREADPRATALVCVTAVEGLGYRPTEARPSADWRYKPGGTGVPKSDEVRALLDAAKRDCDAATLVVRRDDPPGDAA